MPTRLNTARTRAPVSRTARKSISVHAGSGRILDEMPGLTLTLPQASRLFSIEPTRCGASSARSSTRVDLATDGKAFASPRGGRRSV